MRKPIEYNGSIKNVITGEEAPCLIKSKTLKYLGRNFEYVYVHRIPKDSFISKAMAEWDATKDVYYSPPRVVTQYKELPMILTVTDTKAKAAVYLISCSYEGIGYYNVLVRRSFNGCHFSEEVENRMITLEDRTIRRTIRNQSKRLLSITIPAMIKSVRGSLRSGALTSFIEYCIYCGESQASLPEHLLKKFHSQLTIEFGATEDEATELMWFVEDRIKEKYVTVNTIK